MDHTLSLGTGDSVITASIDKVKIYKEHTTAIKPNDEAQKGGLPHNAREHGGIPGTSQLFESIDAPNEDNNMPPSIQTEELNQLNSSVASLTQDKVNADLVLKV